MPPIIVAQFMTLDGTIEDPDGSDGTPFGGWALRHGRDAIAGDKFNYGPIMQSGVFLFGRRTWEHFASLWPAREDPFALAFNAADKAVATSQDIDLSRWSNTRRVTGDVLAWARTESADREVIIIGSGTLLDRFIPTGLVEEYRLRIFPTVTGTGRKLFTTASKLELTHTEGMGPTILAIYRPDSTTPEAANAHASSARGNA